MQQRVRHRSARTERSLQCSLGKLWHFTNNSSICARGSSQAEEPLSPHYNLLWPIEISGVLFWVSWPRLYLKGLATFASSLLEPTRHAVKKSNPSYRMLRGYMDRNTGWGAAWGIPAPAKLPMKAAVWGPQWNQQNCPAEARQPAESQEIARYCFKP